MRRAKNKILIRNCHVLIVVILLFFLANQSTAQSTKTLFTTKDYVQSIHAIN